jgi:hypothetical protein
MTETFTTEGIDKLAAWPLNGPGGWEASFRSTNEGMCHQLYVNGRLADWTDAPSQRRFVIDRQFSAVALTVVAVDPVMRSRDYSPQLPEIAGEPSWCYTATVFRDIKHGAADRAAIMGDRAGGEGITHVLASRELWPAWSPRWAFGEDVFALGGFGYDGYHAPGAGMGVFGIGPFGLDAEAMSISVILEEEGTHQVAVATVSADGQYAQGEADSVAAALPPRAVTAVAATDYDSVTDTLTLVIESD